MILTTKQKLYVEDIDKNLKMTNKSFLKILQETANIASSSVGHGISDIDNTNTTWVILNWRIQILDRAKYEDELTVKTWATFCKKIYSLRFFEVYNKDKLIAKADSKWVFVNSKTHNIEKISDDIIAKYEPEDTRVFDEDIKDHIKFPPNLEKIYSYKIMKRDLDANNHVNNIVFLDIASEVIPDDKLLNTKNINIVYKKEIEYGDTVDCYIQDNTVYLYNSEKNILHGAVTLE